MAIVGAGIIGASIAYHLAKRGAEVTVFEKARPGAGATEKSFAWINAFSKRPRSYFDLNVAGMTGWRRLAKEIPALQIQWGGSVQWHPPGADASKLQAELERLRQWNYSVRNDSVERLLPNVTAGPVGAACFADQEGTVDPMQALHAILDAARRHGAKIESAVEIRKITISNGRAASIETSQGAMHHPNHLVLAAGVDTQRLAESIGVKVPLKESPGVLAHTKPAERLLDRLALAPGANMKQNPDGRIVTGTDFGGSPVRDTSAAYGRQLLDNAARFLPKLKGVELENVTLGYRVLPVDDHPIVGFAPQLANVYIAAMHSGITLSPAIGEFAAAEILDRRSMPQLSDFRPSRFV